MKWNVCYMCVRVKMAYLRKFPNSKYWQVQWVCRDANGRRVWRTRSTGQTDYDKAMAVLEIWEAAEVGRLARDRINNIVQSAGLKPIFTDVDLKDLWEWYNSHCEMVGDAKTQRDKRNTLNRFIEWCKINHPEIKQVREVSLSIASEFWKSLADSQKAASTRNNTLSALNSIWSDIHAPMELDDNPWKAIRRDRGGSIKYCPFTLDELDKLRESARKYKGYEIEKEFWPTAIEIGFYTGLRLGDIATLDWEELSQDDNFLILKPNKTKHWNEDRVTVHSLSLPWVKMLPPRKESGSLFPLAAEVYKDKNLSREFTNIALAAGIEIDREPNAGERRQRKVKLKCFHSLRHTFATIMLSNGISEEELKNQGNWNGIDVINQHYNHAKLALAKQSALRIADVMKKIPMRDANSHEDQKSVALANGESQHNNENNE